MELWQIVELIAITALPTIELRGAIPVGIAQGISPLAVFALCTLVNILIIIPILSFIDHFLPWFNRFEFVRRTLEKVQDKSRKYVEKYGFLGLMVFVAIPLPGSGAYSGSLAAYLFNIPRKQAIPAIAAGVLIAGVVVALASFGVFSLLT